MNKFDFPMPWLLQGSSIPPAVHGIAPRAFMPEQWWMATAEVAKEANGGKCWACGKAPSTEAHETYVYVDKVWIYSGVVGLCDGCHSYIHIGRAHLLVKNGSRTSEWLYHICVYGWAVLMEAGYSPTGMHLFVIGRYLKFWEKAKLDVSMFREGLRGTKKSKLRSTLLKSIRHFAIFGGLFDLKEVNYVKKLRRKEQRQWDIAFDNLAKTIS